jgi:hypothetical protein
MNWDGVRFSPMPDYYFVQGDHFKKELEQYYPENRISVIGCLKYDKYVSILHNREKIKTECRQALKLDTQKVMLIAPSVTDLSNILDFFADTNFPKGWRIIISPHPFIPLARYRSLVAKMGLANAVEFAPNIPTYKLLTVSNLVVCGYSATAYEAAVFGVRSVRLFRESTCPQFDEMTAVPSFKDKHKFWDWVRTNFRDERQAQGVSHENDQLVSELFYKVDGLSADRLWKGLRSQIIQDKESQPVT